MPSESVFQASLIRDIKLMVPGLIVLKNDPSYLNDFPDWIFLCGNRWAVIEAKRSSSAHHQPNQDYYIELLNKMSYASFAYPENKERVLHELQQALRNPRSARLSFGK